ncbi:hypothetical protein ABW286_09195 [Erwinia papayae]|uniref:Uncharacterized protein n=1 Tax=Erwinia papayae TaxID=206499 RepID=A0ABV3N0L2_9GAMM
MQDAWLSRTTAWLARTVGAGGREYSAQVMTRCIDARQQCMIYRYR